MEEGVVSGEDYDTHFPKNERTSKVPVDAMQGMAANQTVPIAFL